MQKAPEEGRIWEWRAFGTVGEEITNKVRSLPVRMGIVDLTGEDVYYISPASDQNVKLRWSSAGWVLKFKILIESRPLEKLPGSLELYDESARLTYPLPATAEALTFAARLLSLKLPPGPSAPDSLDEAAFTSALAGASPPAPAVRVRKSRSQFESQGGWVELAEVAIAGRAIQSLSLHAFEVEDITAMLRQLQPGPQLDPMNYVQACRRLANVP
jgi:hypothetical protein